MKAADQIRRKDPVRREHEPEVAGPEQAVRDEHDAQQAPERGQSADIQREGGAEPLAHGLSETSGGWGLFHGSRRPGQAGLS